MDNNEEYLRDTFIEDLNQKESEDDVGGLTDESMRQVVMTSNDWTTETIISQINKGNILLNPSFQRRDAWTKKRKSKFIESLILGLPVPQLVLAQSKEFRGKYIVLDGKQRLLSIRQFAAIEGDEFYTTLKLTGLDIRTDLNGKTFQDFQSELDLYDDLSVFENQPIRTVIIKNWPSETFLYHVFLRLNTESVMLSTQELRQALHPGRFVSFIDDASQKSAALRDILKNPKPDFRMRDAELLVRYYAFSYFLSQYSGNLKVFLDETCQKLNAAWEDQQSKIIHDFENFEIAHFAIRKVFGENAYHKWNGDAFENRFNRAIFDILLYVFKRETVRELLLANPEKTIDIFKYLFSNDSEFLASIEQTTKSIGATHTRLDRWCRALNHHFNLDISVPSLI